MRVLLIFAVITCIGISPIIVSSQGCISNNCTTSQTYRPSLTQGVLEGADYILNTTETVATIGTSLWDFIEDIDSPTAIGDLLESTVAPTLTYLAGLNDTLLEPFYPEIFRFIDDLANELYMDISANPAQSAGNLVSLLERGISLGINITSVILSNNTEVEMVLDIIRFVLSFPGLRDNITCLLTEVLSDPSIGSILSQFDMLFNMTRNLTIARPILQLFSDSDLFYNKFYELSDALPSSNAVSLCVDAFLTNLVCPFESRYCHANCADTLVYCTALLSQSLQDFSDVLDAVALLAVGYVNSDEFEMFLNEFRNELISTVNSSLEIFSNFDIVEFVNTTLTDCNLIPLINQFLVTFQAFSPNVTLSPTQLRTVILTGISIFADNISLHTASAIGSIEQGFDLQGLRNLTYSVSYLPNGYILNGVLSLSIYYIQLYRPQACGQASTAGVPPLSFLSYIGYSSNCFDGNSVVSFDPNSFDYGYPISYDFSFYSIDSTNQAANRTCTFNQDSFFNSTIETNTTLCAVFLPLSQQSINVLRYAIDNYGKLQFCESFIGNATPPIDCILNECITSQTYRPSVTQGVLEGADYILNTTETVATIGTSLWDFIEEIDSPTAIGNLLNSTVAPSLTYLAGLNDTLLEPFYPEIFRFIDDLANELYMDLSANPAQSAGNLVSLLERGISLGINITSVILSNNPEVEMVLDIIRLVLSFPGLRDNITCILTEVLSDPSIGSVLSQFNTLFNMTRNLTIARPILQLFSDSDLFYNKFYELNDALPSSNAVSLCVDAFLTNLVCPNQSRYCHANCADTLVYCTALLSQSLQDFSDVLDAMTLLAVGYVNSDEFEMFFNEFRNELISTVNSSLEIFYNFDIVEFVNTTLTDCNLIPLINQFLVTFQAFSPNVTLSPTELRFLILTGVSGIADNISVDTASVIGTIEQGLDLQGLRNLTYSVSYLPNGYILNGVLSLSIYYTLLYRPPQGCGQVSTAGLPPLLFLPYFGYYYNCFNGNSFVLYDPKSYYYGYPISYDFSFYSINYSNQAANRTCTFNQDSFFNSTIETNTTLCAVFLPLSQQSINVLRYAIDNYGKLQFCESFIGNATPPIDCILNECITSQTYRPSVTQGVLEGADYILNTTETVATIGTSLWDFIEDIGSPTAIGDLLESTVAPSLTYLAGLNDTLLEPFYPEIFRFIDDLANELYMDLSANPAQSAGNLVSLLERGISLGINITSVILSNNPEVEMVLDIIRLVLSFPGLRDNITCILTEVLSDPSIGSILSQFDTLFNMTRELSIARPILQLFSDSDLFYNKFYELSDALPSSNAVSLCVDAFLTNLVCPFESRYCHANCADTLVYCTALLSQSLQDFSDVLDAVALLAVGHVNSDEFEMFFNEFRNELISTVNSSLEIFSTFDIVEFVNTTLTDCNLIPLINQFLVTFQVLPPNVTLSPTQLRFLILTGISGIVDNISVDTASVIGSIEQGLDLQGLRNLTYSVSYLPNGYILNGVLSLSIYYTLLYRPPQGCGQVSTAGLPPLSFLPYFGYYYNCFNGNSVVSFDPKSYYYGYPISYDFSFYSIDSTNQAANRTCTFNQDSFLNSTLETNTTLCAVFLPLSQQSINVLRYAIDNYGKLQFCESFIGNATPPIDCILNECITSQTYRPSLTQGVLEGADYILNTTETVATIGTSLWDFIEDIDSPTAIGDLLESTVAPSLTYLAGLNDTLLEPFYPEIFRFIDDLANELYMDLSANPAQSAGNLVSLLERGISLGINITSVILSNNPEVEMVLDIIRLVLSFPGLRDNITCLLTEVLSDPSIGSVLSQFDTLFNMTRNLTIARPILQLFSDSDLFYNKFYELSDALPSSNAVSLCVDAFLTNLVCPFESRYCHANCADTLVYCTALLSQSLQDFSDVLDAMALLAVGYVNSDEFEMFFNEFRNELISTVNSSLEIFSTFDIVEFVNTTLTDCNLIPLINQFLVTFQVFPPNVTLSPMQLRFLILTGISGIVDNISVDTASVIGSIEQGLDLQGLRNLTYSVYALPNGYILNGVLSLSIYYTLLYRPPQGCGQVSTAGVPPLSFLPYFGYYYNCFDGNTVVFYDPKSYYYIYPIFYDFSFYSIDSTNQAANRTCTFSQDSFFNSTIETNTTLCAVFLPLNQQSINVLRDAIDNYGKLQFCESFIGNATPPIDCILNECITSQTYRPSVTQGVLEGADYILNTTETVATIGTSLWDFIEEIDSPTAIGDLLESTVAPSLTYLAGLNDTLLEPFYPEIFRFIDDLANELYMDLSANPAQSAGNLVSLLERGISLGINITSVILSNNPEVEMVLDVIRLVLSFPGLRDNITCILTEVLSDPSIGSVLSQFDMLFNMTRNLTIARPILQLFSDSDLFYNKFYELSDALPSSNAVSLCVDAFLTNLVCPFESRYCHANCADTLVYCTALLSQSLQDFSDVLDAVALLAVGYVNSDEFEMFFNEFRNELISTVNSSLGIFSNFDIVEFVNMTLTDCNLIPLINQFLVTFQAFPPNVTLSPMQLRFLILTGISGIVDNISVDTASVIGSIEQGLDLQGLRNLTYSVYYLPNGYILNGVLSLSIYYTLLYRPPQGCGQAYTAGVPPLSFLPYFGYYYNCFNGTSFVFYDPKSLNYIYPIFYDFSFYSIDYTNQAANRTCTFNQDSFLAARLNTTFDLCTVFLTLNPDSRTILRYFVNTQNRIPFCRSFILVNVTQPTTAVTTPVTTTVTTPVTTTILTGTTPAPILPPMVSFPTPEVTVTANVSFEYPCTGTGTDVTVNIVLLNDTQQDRFSQVVTGSRSRLIFNSSMAGNFTFQCTGVNSIGSDSASLLIIVRSISDNINLITSIMPGEMVSPEQATVLISVLGSLVSSDAITGNADNADQLLTVTETAIDSLVGTRNITAGEAESVLLLLGNIESIPDTGVVTTQPPPAEGEPITLAVSRAAIIVAEAVDRIASNLAEQQIPGEPPTIVTSDEINITAVAFIPNPSISSFPVPLQNDDGASIDIPNNFPPGARLSVGASIRSSPLRVVPPAGGMIEATETPQLNSDLISLDLTVNGVVVDLFEFSPTLNFQTSPSSNNANESCVFINVTTGLFETAGVTTFPLLDGSISCQPVHSTSFGVLIRARAIELSPAETLALSIISYTLLSISLIFLVLSIIFFLIASKKFFKVETNILYFNFAISLTLATSVFIFGIQSAKDSIIGCCIVVFFLHYFWLSVFSWSFAISIFMIYILYFGVLQRRRIWWIIMMLGWGIPVPIVFITIGVGVSRGAYATIGDHCFLSYQDGLIWGFLAPLIILVICSSIGAVCATVKIFLTVRNKGDKTDDLEAMKKLAVSLMVLLPILSIPWILGAINAFITLAVTTTILEWVTILLTAPTGLLFFLLVVLRNPQVQEVVLKRKTQGAPTSSQQTSGGISSKFTMPSKAKGSTGGTLEKEEPTAITNPAYEVSTVMEKDVEGKGSDSKAEVAEHLYTTFPVQEKPGTSKAYTTLAQTEDPTGDNESPLHKYAEL